MPRRAHPVRSGRTDVEAVFSTCWTDKDPIRVVSSLPSTDRRTDVAQKSRRRCDVHQRDVPFFLEDFVDPNALCLSTAFNVETGSGWCQGTLPRLHRAQGCLTYPAHSVSRLCPPSLA
jgi:hypothetical protein